MSRDSHGDIPGARCIQTYLPAVGAADATIAYPIFRAPDTCVVSKVEIVPQAAITGQDTNYRELNLINAGSAGAGTTELANIDLASGTNLTALDGKAFTLAANVSMSAGDVLKIESALVGETGLAVPALLVYVEYETK